MLSLKIESGVMQVSIPDERVFPQLELSGMVNEVFAASLPPSWNAGVSRYDFKISNFAFFSR